MRGRSAASYLFPDPNRTRPKNVPGVPAKGFRKILYVLGAMVGTIGFLVVLAYIIMCETGLILLGYRRGFEIMGVYFALCVSGAAIWAALDKKKRART